MAEIKFTNQWGSFELLQPEWLWLIPALIIILLILQKSFSPFIQRRNSANHAGDAGFFGNKKTIYHPLSYFFLKQDKKSKTTNKVINYLFYFIIVTLLAIALTQPVRIGEKRPPPAQERDIVFIVDTSVSMILRDYVLNGQRIDRMSLLKAVLDRFIQKLQGEQMSIIVFGDNAYTLVPLTADQHLLRTMLGRIQATMAGRFNAMGAAITLAVSQAETSNKQRKRVLVLLTDADQPTGDIDPIDAAQYAKSKQLPIYTIAIGSTSYKAEEKRQGGLLYSPVDLQLIENISAITGAKTYQAGSSNALQLATEAISLHESNKKEINPQFYKEALYYWFLIVAVSLYTLRQLISVVNNTVQQRRKTA